MNAPQYRWSDAWLLLAIGYAAQHGAARLADVVGVADGLQHAIPTIAEVNGALGRLSRGGYVEPLTDDGRFRLTASGRALIAVAETDGRRALDVQAEVGRLLAAPAWSAAVDPSDALGSEDIVVSESVLAATYADYLRQLRGPTGR